MVGYLDGVPSGWCAVAPRPGYTRLIRAAALYHGALSVFLRSGFTEVARPTPDRPSVRLAR